MFEVERLKIKYLARSFLILFTLHTISVVSIAGVITGTVTDFQKNSLADAIVRLQGNTDSTKTQSDGTFTLVVGHVFKGKYITAWKNGYYNGGQIVALDKKEYQVVLHKIPTQNNKEYKWLQALTNSETGVKGNLSENQSCDICHPDLTKKWKKSTHATSATNELFLSFFNGTDNRGKKDVGVGYKLDFPGSNGNCVTCHIPMQAFTNPFDSDPNKAERVEREGISCDICHKIRATTIDHSGGKPGILSMEFHRPKENQLFYGPYTDVFPGDDSYSPLYKNSKYCAPCHHGIFWNQLVYSEYKEWAESSYAQANTHCQNCHMKPQGKSHFFASRDKGGVSRPPESISTHDFSGINDYKFMREAIGLDIAGRLIDDALKVDVTVKNIKAGHSYPTGSPMRNMILIVTAEDSKGEELPLSQGSTIPPWGGIGAVIEGNYAGLPGKGFAKIFRDVMPYPDNRISKHFQDEYPAPYWRPVVLESDTRIPADGEDHTSYIFSLSDGASGAINVTAKLIFRRTFKKWSVAKGWNDSEFMLFEKKAVLAR